MLILSRKINESIIIDGRITVKILRVEGEIVKIGIVAPSDVPIHRQEVYEEIQANNREAATRGQKPSLPKLQVETTSAEKNGLPPASKPILESPPS